MWWHLTESAADYCRDACNKHALLHFTKNNFSAAKQLYSPPRKKEIPIIIRHLLLSRSRSTTERTADVKAFGPIKVCDMPPFPLPPAPATLITDVLVCLWARRSLASLITNLETSHLLYLFFFFFPPSFHFHPQKRSPTFALVTPKGGIKEINLTCVKKWSAHLVWIFGVSAGEEGAWCELPNS